jgi:hypothetical protein
VKTIRGDDADPLILTGSTLTLITDWISVIVACFLPVCVVVDVDTGRNESGSTTSRVRTGVTPRSNRVADASMDTAGTAGCGCTLLVWVYSLTALILTSIGFADGSSCSATYLNFNASVFALRFFVNGTGSFFDKKKNATGCAVVGIINLVFFITSCVLSSQNSCSLRTGSVMYAVLDLSLAIYFFVKPWVKVE